MLLFKFQVTFKIMNHVLITGGGVYNTFLMDRIKALQIHKL